MTNVVNIESQDVLVARAEKSAMKIHAADKTLEIAKCINDREKYEAAARVKVEAQAEFAGVCKVKFPHGAKQFGPREAAVASLATFCRSFGFAERTVKNWYPLLDESEREVVLVKMLRRCWSILSREEPVRASSESAEWYTPPEYLEAARKVLGAIDLDPSSNEVANRNVKAKKFFTIEDDGLSKKWHGRVFMNPPYGKLEDGSSLAALFCDKAINEYQEDRVKAAIILVNSMHSQRWQSPLYSYPICFVDHRIKFVVGDGTAENKSPTFQNMFVYLGRDTQRFADVFDQFGFTMSKING
jgi:hypothetical protein